MDETGKKILGYENHLEISKRAIDICLESKATLKSESPVEG